DRSEDILVGPELSEACAAATVRMKRGFRTDVHAHDEQEQLFVVLHGKGRMTIGEECEDIRGGMAVYITRKAMHAVEATSRELVYIYVSVWPEKKPPGLKPKILKEGRIMNITYE
ncbi:MAG: cupin domain-containing protein, partial [Spirochaetes bacterium]|nr:cupin domain-containing protein [Spirochaetota bacterium]